MANPYSPSFRPILSNPLASALQGLAQGGLTGYQLVQQSRQQQADNTFRAKQLQNAQDELDLKRMQAGWTPAGVSPLRGSGSLLGMANEGLGATTGTLGVAGVLPQTDVVANQPAHLDFSQSSEGQRVAAELRNQAAMERQRNADDIASLHLRYGDEPGVPGIQNAGPLANDASLAAQRQAEAAATAARDAETARHHRALESRTAQGSGTSAGVLAQRQLYEGASAARQQAAAAQRAAAAASKLIPAQPIGFATPADSVNYVTLRDATTARARMLQQRADSLQGVANTVNGQLVQRAMSGAALAPHVPRDGTEASALRAPSGSGVAARLRGGSPAAGRTPLSVLGNRQVADSSTDSYPSASHLPAHPSDDTVSAGTPGTPGAIADFQRANAKAQALRARGVPEAKIRAALLQDIDALSRKHGITRTPQE